MIQFQENTWADERMAGQTDPLSQDPSSYHQESKKGQFFSNNEFGTGGKTSLHFSLKWQILSLL